MKTLSPLKSLLPWLAALAILLGIFHYFSWREAWNSLQHAAIAPLLGFSLFYFLYILLIDAFSLRQALQGLAPQLNFRALLSSRCKSYLVSIFNYHAGQLALAAQLQKDGVPFFRALGTLSWISLIDLLWVFTLAGFGWWRNRAQLPSDLQALFPPLILLGTAALATILFLMKSPRLKNRFPRLLSLKILAAFQDATWAQNARMALYRLPIHLMFIVSMWGLARIFGAQLSWATTFATVPIIYLIGALPITPGGLGSTQAASVLLLKNQLQLPAGHLGIAPEEILLAMSLSWTGLNYFFKALGSLAAIFSEKIRANAGASLALPDAMRRG